MHLHRVLRSLLLLLAMVGVWAQETDELRLGPLYLTFPVTWSFDGAKRPMEGKGPEGEKLQISIARKRPGAQPDPAKSLKEVAQGLAGSLMADYSTKNDLKIVKAMSEQASPEGTVTYAVGSEASSMFDGKSYFIQYMLVSPDAMIYLTFEGKGEALPAMQRFDALIATQLWGG